MRRNFLTTGTVILVLLTFLATPPRAGDATDAHWPSFRGPRASGIAEGHATPTRWNVETSENVKWKTPIPGLAHSSPVIWGDRVFVTTAVSASKDPELKVGLYGNIDPVNEPTVHRWRVYCLDKQTGRILWDRTAHEGVPKIKRHTKATHANSTPATDGKHVVAFFGSEGLYCYDMKGKLLWKKDLGVLDSGFFRVPSAQWGFGSSPIIHENMVIVQCDVQKDSFLAAFDIKDGREIWRAPRDEVPTWSTPTVHEGGGRSQIVVNGYRHIGGYDSKTGKELWRMKGGGDIPAPTPFVAHDLIFISNAHGDMSPIYAIRTDAKGDISLEDGATSNAHVAWSYARRGAYMPTPVAYGDHLYVCRDSGVLHVYEARTGNKIHQQRLGGGNTGFTASVVAANGKLYVTSEMGEIYVVKAAPEFELLATNEMGEVCMATPAISEGTLFFRTRSHLVAIGETGKKKGASN